MIVIPGFADGAARRYAHALALSASANAFEAALARQAAEVVATKHGIADVELVSFLPDGDGWISRDGITVVWRDRPWWRSALLLAILERVGGIFDEAFRIQGHDNPWQIAEDGRDVAIRVVGHRAIVELVRVLYAACSLGLAMQALRRQSDRSRQRRAWMHATLFGTLQDVLANERWVRPEDDELAVMIGAIGGIALSLREASRERGRALEANAKRDRQRTAMVLWSSSEARSTAIDEGQAIRRCTHHGAGMAGDGEEDATRGRASDGPLHDPSLHKEARRLVDEARGAFVAGDQHGYQLGKAILYGRTRSILPMIVAPSA